MKKQKDKQLKERKQYWIDQGKRLEQITYGMLGDGFSSIPGIPDEFYSAEDPKDRARLWGKNQPQPSRLDNDGEYKGYGEWRD